MGCYNDCNQGNCTWWSASISIIVGVLVGVLYFLGLIPVPLNLVRIALVFSVIAMGIILGIIYITKIMRCDKCLRKCICKVGNCLLIGTIGTFLTATAAAIIGVVTVTIASTIAIGLTALFFVLLLIQIIVLLNCLIDNVCYIDTINED